MKTINQKIVTRSGTYPYIRVDSAFLCACGCGRRVATKNRFFSKECYGKYVRENNIQIISPESVKKANQTRKELKQLLEGLMS